IEEFPQSKYMFVFLSQHAGYPATAVVKQGERVKFGQKIAESSGLISAPVHCPVSGRVTAIEEKLHPTLLRKMPAIIIENDFSDERDDDIVSCSEWHSVPAEKLIELVKQKGIVGLGGAMFPTHVKFFPPKKPLDTLIVNGCECEPYLNADNRLMIEHPEEILQGIMLARKILGVNNVIIGIEENKPVAIENMKRAIGEKQGFILKELKTKYPQGAEKMLIRTTLGRRVPDGGLPLDVGVVVLNVGTVFAIYRAIVQGLPLVKRVITVSGEFERQGNFEIRMGTPFKDILEFCKSKISENAQEYCLKMGGPMMGIIQTDPDSAVIKGTTGFVLAKKFFVDSSEKNTCIKCGRCVDVCPMELYPLYYAYYGTRKMWEKCVEYGVKNCIECGCCQYICSSKIALVDLIKQAKRNANNKT
ncbi:MAG TPA: electron transport complex subunit RsxC, partial [bacterium]|nr:electron transport complex subunit RsxC [bacterium]HPP09298.1 electron transport complex subunit RsxC [bacterium]